MNRKVLYSVIVIGVVASLAIGGTYAYFTALRTTSANKFAAGTLDLDVSANGNKLEKFVVDNMGVNGKIGGTKTWTIKNTGSLPGRVMVSLKDVQNHEDGCNDQESAKDSTCDTNSTDGELGGVVNLKVALDGTAKNVSSTLATNQQAIIGENWSKLEPIVLAAGETKTITASWEASEDTYGNEIQGDTVQFDMNFRLIQNITGEVSSNI